MEEVNVGGTKTPTRNGTFAALYCAIFCTPSFRKSFKFFGTPIVSLDPETVEEPAFSILYTMFTGVCGPPEKLSLAVAPRSYVLRMIVKLSYSWLFIMSDKNFFTVL